MRDGDTALVVPQNSILTSSARLASSALTEWLSISFDVHPLEPTHLHDASYPNSIVAVSPVGLHLEHGLGMARRYRSPADQIAWARSIAAWLSVRSRGQCVPRPDPLTSRKPPQDLNRRRPLARPAPSGPPRRSVFASTKRPARLKGAKGQTSPYPIERGQRLLTQRAISPGQGRESQSNSPREGG
jgi:hypothetical protein